MHKFIAKYGLAAHLSLLAVTPLILFPFFEPDPVSSVLLWLSLVSFLWSFLAPSQIHGEQLHDSRRRVFKSVLSDPLFWVSLFLIAAAGVRWFNCGVKLVYDAETLKWSVGGVAFPLLPTGLKGSGRYEFSCVIALSVLLLATRHSLGKAARTAFLFSSSVMAGCAGVCACTLVVFGQEKCVSASQCSLLDPQFVGMTFAVFVLGGVVSFSSAVERKNWFRVRPLVILALGGGFSAVVYFSPAIDIAIVSAAVVILTLVSLFYNIRRVGSASLFRALALLSMAVFLVVLFIAFFAPPTLCDGRLGVLKGRALFPDGYFQVRAVMAEIAARAWKGGLWLGTGINTIAFDLRFLATDADWMRLSPMQTQLTHGWWQLLAERGIVGVAFMAVPCLFVAWTYFRRLIFSFGRHGCQSVCWLAPALVAMTVGVMFFDASLLRPDCLTAVLALISVSSTSFPPPASKDTDEADENVVNGDMPMAGGLAKG